MTSKPADTILNFHNTSVTAATNIRTTSYSPPVGYPETATRITITLHGAGGVLTVVTTKNGADPVTSDLNSGVALVTGQKYTFVWGASRFITDAAGVLQSGAANTLEYNLRVSVTQNANIHWQEILDGGN